MCDKCGAPQQEWEVTDGFCRRTYRVCMNGHDAYSALVEMVLPPTVKTVRKPGPHSRQPAATEDARYCSLCVQLEATCIFCPRSKKAGNGPCARHDGLDRVTRSKQRRATKAARWRARTKWRPLELVPA